MHLYVYSFRIKLNVTFGAINLEKTNFVFSNIISLLKNKVFLSAEQHLQLKSK